MNQPTSTRGLGLTITYWVVTGIFAFFMAMGGYMDFAPSEEIAKEIAKTGYPLFFFKILGVWKMLGGLALLLPKTPRLKEWAYAGFFFNLTGASATHVFLGDPWYGVVIPLVALAVGAVSYFTRPPERKL